MGAATETYHLISETWWIRGRILCAVITHPLQPMATKGRLAARKQKQHVRFRSESRCSGAVWQGDTVRPWASTSGTWPRCGTSSRTACRPSSSAPSPTSSRTGCPTCGGASARRSSRWRPVSRSGAERGPDGARGGTVSNGVLWWQWGFVVAVGSYSGNEALLWQWGLIVAMEPYGGNGALRWQWGFMVAMGLYSEVSWLCCRRSTAGSPCCSVPCPVSVFPFRFQPSWAPTCCTRGACKSLRGWRGRILLTMRTTSDCTAQCHRSALLVPLLIHGTRGTGR